MAGRGDNGSLRVAVVGLGYWGPNLVRVVHDLPQFELAYVCDLRPDLLARVGRRYGSVQETTEFERVLADDSVDAILIATPVSTHFALAAAALAAGKHVFVEKPLAGSSVDAANLLELAQSSDLVLMPGHTFLYSPSVNLVRDLFESGELGEIYFISTSRVNLGLHQADVSVVWDLAPHDFSILAYWLGELPTSVSALSRSCIIPGIPDVAFINLEYGSGTVAHVEISWLAPSKLRRTAIVGSQKMVVYDDTSNEPVRIFDSGVVPRNPTTFGEYQLAYRSGDIVSPRIDATEPLTLELIDFSVAIETGSEPRSSASLGLDVVRMIEAVDRSLTQNGSLVSFEDALLQDAGPR
ncbi:MAG TPA: Gfo/Idh/MocA family oxidoreductase [Gaiellaceae bacterium]